jgi:type VI secretion system protein ImpA
MILASDLLQPIPGENPSGVSLRGSELYAQVEEARRKDDDLPKGVWKEGREAKRANFGKAAQLCVEALSKRSKDLQLAAWLCEAWLHTDGFGGLSAGLRLCRRLLEEFWDTVHPALDEDGDPGRRVGILNWIGVKLGIDCRMTALTPAGYGLIEYEQSRLLPNDKATGSDAKPKRDKAVAERKLLPEVFDKAFEAAGKAFYANLVTQLDECAAELDELVQICRSKFGDEEVSFGDLRQALQAVTNYARVFLERKREIDPDPEPDEPRPPDADGETKAEAVGTGGAAAALAPIREIRFVAAEPAGRREAVAGIVAAAAYLRKHEPLSPAPYLILRGLRWGELRAAVAAQDPTALEPPPTEVRTQIKRLAIARRWNEALEAAEQAMALPAGRAWLDLQRIVVEACRALGRDYDAIAQAVSSALCALLSDLPQLCNALLLDDTPAANSDTCAWIATLLADGFAQGGGVRWNRAADASQLAADAAGSGNHAKALEILYQDLERQQSGRARFQRKLQIAEMCMKAGKDTIAQPLLDDIAAAIETYKLEEWEDPEFVADVLLTLMQSSKRIQGDAKEKQKLFERICRLHPVKALSC